jgi:hypothetical protein
VIKVAFILQIIAQAGMLICGVLLLRGKNDE